MKKVKMIDMGGWYKAVAESTAPAKNAPVKTPVQVSTKTPVKPVAKNPLVRSDLPYSVAAKRHDYLMRELKNMFPAMQ